MGGTSLIEMINAVVDYAISNLLGLTSDGAEKQVTSSRMDDSPGDATKLH